MATIKERVQAGAALLDKVLPDWWNGKETPTIDLEILNMSCGGDCVLGQAYGSYLRGSQMLGLPFYGSGVNNAGFNAVDEAEFDRLDKAWKTEIKRRRREGS